MSSDLLCRSASARVEVGGRAYTRSAAFYLPPPPAGELLPSDTVRVAEGHCHLRGVWLETTEPDSGRAVLVADSIAATFDAALGLGRPSMEMDGHGTRSWSSTRSWSGPGTVVVLGVVPPWSRFDDNTGTEVPTTPRRVVLAAFAPHSGLDRGPGAQNHLFDYDAEGEGEADLELDRADSAIAWMALPRIATDLRTVLTAVRTTPERETGETAALDSAIMRAAITTRDTLPSIGASRGAAAMLALDIVIERYARALDSDTSGAVAVRRAAMQAAGIPYEHDPLAAVYRYTRPWLWESYRLDVRGPAGRAALTTLLAKGWWTRPGCEPAHAEYERVIGEGEAALARGITDPLVHYYVGIAHHDIVALAHGTVSEEYADSTKFTAKAPAARLSAIAHLRAALAGLSDRRLRRHAWRTAMTLMLGRSKGTRFYCVYD